MRLPLIAGTFLFLCLSSYAQNEKPVGAAPDSVLFNNGAVLTGHITDTSGDKITIEKLNARNHKKTELDRDHVFSMRYGSTGRQVMVYFYDTLTGHDYTVDEARLFIAGEQDAQRGFHATATNIGAFIIGLGSGIASGSFIAFAPPFIYSGILTIPIVRIRHKSVSNLEYVKHDPYLYGYDNTARRKRTLKALLWGSIGVVAGYVLNYSGATNSVITALHL